LVKGGKLANEVFPALLINLTVSDVIGDPLDYITDPTVPDTSTYLDAWETLDKYHLWNKIPVTVKDYLLRGDEIETPKTFTHKYYTYNLVPCHTACIGAAQRCIELGFPVKILTNSLEGDSREAAINFVDSALSLCNQHPPRFAVLASGETTVTIQFQPGKGGPNQEFALSASTAIAGRINVVVAAIGTDGTDGPVEATGGLVDGGTFFRAGLNGLDPQEALQKHDAGPILEATGDLVITGPTGTNVNDLIFCLMDST
jgi:hydroxypyruvate reductase/glycerate 2-kinase